MDGVETIVVGAGVVGLAVARALALAGQEVILIEREAAIGQGISSRNSEVIHAGLYYPSGSLKAKLCARGKALLYDYCAERQLPHRRCGKLIVATDTSQLETLAQIEVQAAAHGVPLQRLDRTQATALERELVCVAALLSPTTGIVSAHDLMLALQGDFENAGGSLVLSTQVQRIDLTQDKQGFAGSLVAASVSRGADKASKPMELGFRHLVNAAGLNAPRLAAQISGLAAAHVPQAHYAKGNYYALASRAPFSHLIYPIPQAAGLGVHLTLDLGGQARFGPDVQWLEGIHTPEDIDYSVDPRRAESFYDAVRTYWPGLRDGQLSPSYSGVRPKITGPHEAAADFVIQGAATHGVHGLVNLFGIESPGLTSCLAIGEEVRALLSEN